jgi:hypothetical protein
MRGYFIDLRTIGAALTSELHTLESLAKSLGVEHPKERTVEHGKALTASYISYAVRDVVTTWECFVGLRERYDSHQLRRTLLNRIYSEASLGKAYLREMGISPWRTMQPDFPPELIGIIISAYYGGRAEIRIRRSVTQVLYCDFASMYPTVCTLMLLWDFVAARGMTWQESAKETQLFLDQVTLSDLQQSQSWRKLHTIVQVQPDADIFPVRGRYADQQQYTIGLNYLTSEFPLWFTLADCIASKLLTGKTSKVVKAYTFSPSEKQLKLWPVNIFGNSEYRVDPSSDDFYRRLVDLRHSIQRRKDGASGQEADNLDTKQFTLKILANATSYGIFVELNVDEKPAQQPLRRYGVKERGEPIASDKVEEPGEYFHPLLGALITGAARLMLAIAETLVRKSGLDWALCDTDSMAIAKPAGMADTTFYDRTQAICGWFKLLNPYSADVEIFKIEDENWAIESGKATSTLEPLFCYAVSAKRYTLFNLAEANATPILRKASAHGLGHWLPPYDDESAPPSFPHPVVKLKGVKRWQHDIWHRTVTAALAETDTNTNPAADSAFDKPVASPYLCSIGHGPRASR